MKKVILKSVKHNSVPLSFSCILNFSGQGSHPFFPLSRVALLKKGEWQKKLFGRKSFGAANVPYVPAGGRAQSMVQ